MTLKELMFEGSNKFFDQTPIAGLSITDKEIQDLCLSLKENAIRNSKSENEKSEIKTVTANTLLSWGVLVERDGEYLPTNAYALLTGNPILQTKVQCGVFKGKSRAVFVDRREYTGSIQEQIEEAYRYVLAKINLGAKIEGLYREDIYEFPIRSIREIISNAIAHRSYLEPGNVQIALYDDRLEVTSPGMLLNGVTIEKIREGYSKIRNRAIANAFSYMKIIEEWGSGIPRMIEEFEEYGLREPELIDLDGDFRVNFYRSNYESKICVGQVDRAIPKSETLNETLSETLNETLNETLKLSFSEREKNVLDVIIKNPSITQLQISDMLHIPISAVKRCTSDLQKQGILKRDGARKKGKWEVQQ